MADLAGNLLDQDRDGVPDATDNCPTTYNPPVASWVDKNNVTHTNSQVDFDLDGVGDGCDNCPLRANVNQTDANGDGIGDICADSNNNGIVDYAEAVLVPAAPTAPGAPLWVTATFTYDGQDTTGDGIADPITTFIPDCYNTTPGGFGAGNPGELFLKLQLPFQLALG